MDLDPLIADLPIRDSLTPHYIAPNPGDSTGQVGFVYDVTDILTEVGARVRGLLGASKRIPFNLSTELVGGDVAGASDMVGAGNSVTISGNFAGTGGSNPTTIFGANDFIVRGTASGDGASIDNIFGRLSEVAVATPDGTLAVAIGFMGEVSLFGPDAGATITKGISIRAGSPKKKEGATGGTIVNATSLYVERPTAGTDSNWAIEVEPDGISRLAGNVKVKSIIEAMSDDMILKGSEAGVGAILFIGDGSGSGHQDITARLGDDGAGDRFKVQKPDATDVFFVTGTGTIGLPTATTFSSASAGGASALPSNPVGYIAIELLGTTRVIPCYATP